MPTIASRCDFFAPATKSMAKSGGMKVRAVPKSGCLKISNRGIPATAKGGSRPQKVR